MSRIVTSLLIISGGFFLYALSSCNKEISPPAIGKPLVSDITINSATLRGFLFWDGGARVSGCGFCWNTSGNPDINDNHAETEEENGKLIYKLSNLDDGIKYFVRFYAKNRKGFSYSMETTFTTKAICVPVVFTSNISSVTHNSAICYGGITSDNSLNTLAKGICWSTSVNPTINDSKTVNDNPYTTYFSEKATGLTPGTVYYLRAYATNEAGTSYGGNRIIKTYNEYITDIEGHIYYPIKIGKQIWLHKNLMTKLFANGDQIPTTNPATLNIEAEEKPFYQWPLSGFEYNVDYYGRLYTWYVVTDSRKICPAGWHIPSVNEFNELLNYLGGDRVLSIKLKEKNNYHWENQLNAGSDDEGFHAVLSGFRTPGGLIPFGRNATYLWSDTESSSSDGYALYYGADWEEVCWRPGTKKAGYSVRCIKD